MSGGRPGAVRVLQSFPQPRPTTNPYVTQLLASLPATVDARPFSWRAALGGDYDVLHLHWPENLLRSPRPGRTAARAVAVAALLVLLRLRGTAVVRTLHNLAPHEPPGRVAAALLRRLDRATTSWIRLTDATPSPGPARTIPHGHYRDWFAGHPVPDPVPGRVATIGLIRPYKGVESLTAAFAALDDGGLGLHVVGRPTTAALRRHLADAARADPRLTLLLDHVDDATLAREVGEAELVVLPHTGMHNSGTALLALSLGRPVLVPSTPATNALAAEVGPGWVQCYEGDFDAAVLRRAVAAVRRARPTGTPRFAGRDWPGIGAAHADVYRAALADRTR